MGSAEPVFCKQHIRQTEDSRVGEKRLKIWQRVILVIKRDSGRRSVGQQETTANHSAHSARSLDKSDVVKLSAATRLACGRGV